MTRIYSTNFSRLLDFSFCDHFQNYHISIKKKKKKKKTVELAVVEIYRLNSFFTLFLLYQYRQSFVFHRKQKKKNK